MELLKGEMDALKRCFDLHHNKVMWDHRYDIAETVDNSLEILDAAIHPSEDMTERDVYYDKIYAASLPTLSNKVSFTKLSTPFTRRTKTINDAGREAGADRTWYRVAHGIIAVNRVTAAALSHEEK